MNRKIIIILFLFINLALFAQEYKLGSISKINLSKSLKNDWKLNLAIESRQIYFDGIFNDKFNSEFIYDRTELKFSGAKKIALNKTLSAGYLVKFQANTISHRFIQQYSILNKFENLKLAHRFSLNQTIQNNSPVEHTVRYRVALEKPLNGNSLDSKEFYIKLSNEFLLYLEKLDVSDIEMRALGVIGYQLNKNNKIESGIDYRIDNLNTSSKTHEFWLVLALYMSL